MIRRGRSRSGSSNWQVYVPDICDSAGLFIQVPAAPKQGLGVEAAVQVAHQHGARHGGAVGEIAFADVDAHVIRDAHIVVGSEEDLRPKGMSDADWKRMRESALEIKQVMDAGCARPALEPEPEVEAPSR